MPRRIASFCGFHVGRAKRVAMADLRTLLASMGYTEVQTLPNRGNAMFSSAGTSAAIHASEIRAAYMCCANSILESKAAVALLNGLTHGGTTRTWATVGKIHALLQAQAKD